MPGMITTRGCSVELAPVPGPTTGEGDGTGAGFVVVGGLAVGFDPSAGHEMSSVYFPIDA